MRDVDVHMTKCKDDYWIVACAKGCNLDQSLGRFRVRSHALAFGRAIAHSGGVELIVHEDDGRVIRHAAMSLSYPSKLN